MSLRCNDTVRVLSYQRISRIIFDNIHKFLFVFKQKRLDKEVDKMKHSN